MCVTPHVVQIKFISHMLFFIYLWLFFLCVTPCMVQVEFNTYKVWVIILFVQLPTGKCYVTSLLRLLASTLATRLFLCALMVLVMLLVNCQCLNLTLPHILRYTHFTIQYILLTSHFSPLGFFHFSRPVPFITVSSFTLSIHFVLFYFSPLFGFLFVVCHFLSLFTFVQLH